MLELTTGQGRIAIDEIAELTLVLPGDPAFAAGDLTAVEDGEIAKIERGNPR